MGYKNRNSRHKARRSYGTKHGKKKSLRNYFVSRGGVRL